MVWYVACTDCENKIRLRSHSSLSWFGMSHVRTVRMIKYDWQAIQVLCTDSEYRGADEVRDDKLRRWRECDKRERERKYWRKTNKVCKLLPSPSRFTNGMSYELARQRANDRNRRAKQCEGPREWVPLVVVAVVIIYAITHTDYTQYINTYNHSQARPTRCL